MKLQEGPLLGAVIIGGGIGYLIYGKTNNPLLAIVSGVALAIADYVLVITLKYNKKDKD